MAINTIDNFSYKGAKPLDARLVFNTLDEMTSYPKENLYVGIIMYCRETSKHYTYNGISIDEMSMGSGTGGSIDESKFALKSELDEFDPNAHEARVNAFIDKAKKDVLTVDKFDAFDPRAHEAKVNTFIDKAKKEVVTLGQLDAFDPNAHKKELQTIANEVTNKMSVFNELTELDLDELKIQLKTEIKAELKKEILAELNASGGPA